MISEQTQTLSVDDYKSFIEKIDSFNSMVKRLQDSNSPYIDVIKNEPNNPAVVDLKNNARNALDGFSANTTYVLNSKTRDIVLYIKNNLSNIFSSLEQFENNLNDLFSSSFDADFEPLFGTILENMRLIVALTDADLVGPQGGSQQPSQGGQGGSGGTSGAGGSGGSQQPGPGGSGGTSATGPASPEEVNDMIKLHGSFDQNSSLDRSKLEMYRKAKQEVGPSASFSDITKAAYKQQYGDTSKYNSEPVKSRRGSEAKSPTAPVTSGESIYFVRVGPGNYRPAVNADLTSGQQLFVRNPNKVARIVYPFIKIQNAPVRRADLPRKNK